MIQGPMTPTSPLRTILLTSLAALSLPSCTRDDTAVKDKLDAIDKRLESIEQTLAKGGGRGMPPGAQGMGRPQPSPTDVFAVDVGRSPVHGKPDAKVTIIEAFEFA